MSNNISDFYQSFSGTDTLAFILMPGCSPVVIGSLTTISYSMYRNKKPVTNLGRISANGITRGVRIYAGTMVFTLINQHWLEELKTSLPWLAKMRDLKVDELPLFDIMIVSANEYGNYVSMYIYGIDFTDEAQVVSVEDMFTENTFSFVSRDVSTFKRGNTASSKNVKTQTFLGSIASIGKQIGKFFLMNSSKDTVEEIIQREAKKIFNKAQKQLKRSADKTFGTLWRSLYYSTSKTMIGNDVNLVKEVLNRLFPEEEALELNGIFDNLTDQKVRKFQSDIKVPIDGVVTQRLYSEMHNALNDSNEKYGVVINRSGTYCFDIPSIDGNVLETLPFNKIVTVLEAVIGNTVDGAIKKFYKTVSGYIPAEDIYSAYDLSSLISFPEIKLGDCNSYVTILQQALNSLFGSALTSGTFDATTKALIEQFQKENGFLSNGIVSNDIWRAIYSLLSTDERIAKGCSIILGNFPGKYNISDIGKAGLSQYGIQIKTNVPLPVKASILVRYADGLIEQKTKTKDILNKELVTLYNMFPDAFVFSPQHGMPKSLGFYVYPYGMNTYKWIVNLLEGEH